MGADPVKIGAVPSLNRPGGNITGAFMLSTELEAKRLELLHEVVPAAKMVGLLVNPTFLDAETQVRDVQAAAQTMAIRIITIRASSAGDIDGAFSELVQQRGAALLVASDPFLFTQRNRIITLAAHHGLPAIYNWRDFAQDGGLMSYGTNLAEPCRLAGAYTAILKGESRAELRVVQSTKVEFAIKLNRSRASRIPFCRIALAEVIEELDGSRCRRARSDCRASTPADPLGEELIANACGSPAAQAPRPVRVWFGRVAREG